MFRKRIGNYRDPSLTRKADAINWVRLQGHRFRGKSEIGAETEAKRREAIEEDQRRDTSAGKPN